MSGALGEPARPEESKYSSNFFLALRVLGTSRRCPLRRVRRSGCARRGFRLRRRGAFVIAFLVGARDDRSCLQILLAQVFAAATRTLLCNWLVRGSELAVRISSATVKRVALASTLLDQFAFLA